MERLTDKPTKVTPGLDEMMEIFWSNPHNRLIMAMFAVNDKDMTVKDALEFAKSTKGEKCLT